MVAVIKKVDLLVSHAAQLVTVSGNSGAPKRGRGMSEIGVIPDGAVAARDGVIIDVGTTEEVLGRTELAEDGVLVDATGKVVLPGLVDPHTHLIFAGSRQHEFEMKIRGKGYLEILAAGGGILNTVKATRAATCDELIAVGEKYLGEMLAHGTTTAEVKSGYGLTPEDEIKMLEAV
ncbi:MAG: amidohydrolase family protein, partial [Desulfofundulus sp.]